MTARGGSAPFHMYHEVRADRITMKRSGSTYYYLAAALVLVTIIVYLPALRNEFVNWDDDVYVYNNLHLRSLDASFLEWAFTTFRSRTWHPLTWISHAVDHAVWGLNPAGHHLVNVLMHAVNAVLVMLLTVALARASNDRSSAPGIRPFNDDRGVLIAGAAAGLLFGLHPLHVEPVAWVSGRKELLSTLCMLLSLLSYARSVRACPIGGGDGRFTWSGCRNRYYLIALGSFCLALLSKAMAVTLPAVLLVLDWHPFNRITNSRTFVRALVEKLPFMTLSIIASLLVIAANSSSAGPAARVPFELRLQAAVQAPAAYLGNMIRPSGLVPFYPYPEPDERSLIVSLVSLVLAAGITVFCVLLAKRNRSWLAVWAGYVITLTPVLGVVQISSHAMADRYAYFPSIGPFILAGAAVAWSWKRTGSGGQWSTARKGTFIVAALFLCTSLITMTVRQISHWRDSIALWNTVIEGMPVPAAMAYNNRGLAYKERGQTQLAMDDFNAAISLNPLEAKPHLNRGVVYGEAGEYALALEELTRALELDPGSAEAYTSRGLIHERLGDLDLALADHGAAITLNPRSVEAYNNRGVVFARRGRLEEARQDYDRALLLDPAYSWAYCNRGLVFGKMQKYAEAFDDLARAVSLMPDNSRAYHVRGDLYLQMDDAARAEDDYRRACDLGNDDGCEALRSLAMRRGSAVRNR